MTPRDSRPSGREKGSEDEKKSGCARGKGGRGDGRSRKVGRNQAISFNRGAREASHGKSQHQKWKKSKRKEMNEVLYGDGDVYYNSVQVKR